MNEKAAMAKNDASTRSAKDWKKSTHHGAGEWLAERFTSLVLIPLTLWCAWAACQVVGGGYDKALAFVHVPLNAGLIGATVLISVWHLYMGLKAIIDDYVAKPGGRGLCLFLSFVLCLLILAATAAGLYAAVTDTSFYALFFVSRGAA